MEKQEKSYHQNLSADRLHMAAATDMTSANEMPFWFGEEDHEHAERVLELYTDHLHVAAVRQPCSRCPLEFIGCIRRCEFPSRAVRLIRARTCPNALQPLRTIDTVAVYQRDLVPMGTLMTKLRTEYWLTEWDEEEGIPIHWRRIEDMQAKCRLLQYIDRGPHFYLFSFPVFEGADDQYVYCSGREGKDIGYASNMSSCIYNTLCLGGMSPPRSPCSPLPNTSSPLSSPSPFLPTSPPPSSIPDDLQTTPTHTRTQQRTRARHWITRRVKRRSTCKGPDVRVRTIVTRTTRAVTTTVTKVITTTTNTTTTTPTSKAHRRTRPRTRTRPRRRRRRGKVLRTRTRTRTRAKRSASSLLAEHHRLEDELREERAKPTDEMSVSPTDYIFEFDPNWSEQEEAMEQGLDVFGFGSDDDESSDDDSRYDNIGDGSESEDGSSGGDPLSRSMEDELRLTMESLRRPRADPFDAFNHFPTSPADSSNNDVHASPVHTRKGENGQHHLPYGSNICVRLLADTSPREARPSSETLPWDIPTQQSVTQASR